MKKVVVFSGAGISAESGLKTFRDSNGLWENYSFQEVATPEAWAQNQSLVLQFYNERRKQCIHAKPNEAHTALVRLESIFETTIITQNIDDLHERAGSTQVIHLHGEIRKSRSTKDKSLTYNIEGSNLDIGDRCGLGSQLRPHVVWFGESVPMLDQAAPIVQIADILIVIGTSLNVYPAAGLAFMANDRCTKFLVDPNSFKYKEINSFQHIQEVASKGVPKLVETLLKAY